MDESSNQQEDKRVETKFRWWIDPATFEFRNNSMLLDRSILPDIEAKRVRVYRRVISDLDPLYSVFLNEPGGETCFVKVSSWVHTWSQNNPYGLCFLTGEGLIEVVRRCLPSHPDRIDNPQELASQLDAADNRLDLPRGPCDICGKNRGHSLPYDAR